ncbi:unnamed protein product, partial [Nesidiocoris tenuis]
MFKDMLTVEYRITSMCKLPILLYLLYPLTNPKLSRPRQAVQSDAARLGTGRPANLHGAMCHSRFTIALERIIFEKNVKSSIGMTSPRIDPSFPELLRFQLWSRWPCSNVGIHPARSSAWQLQWSRISGAGPLSKLMSRPRRSRNHRQDYICINLVEAHSPINEKGCTFDVLQSSKQPEDRLKNVLGQAIQKKKTSIPCQSVEAFAPLRFKPVVRCSSRLVLKARPERDFKTKNAQVGSFLWPEKNKIENTKNTNISEVLDPMDMMLMEHHFLRSPLRLYSELDAENNNSNPLLSAAMIEKARALWGAAVLQVFGLPIYSGLPIFGMNNSINGNRTVYIMLYNEFTLFNKFGYASQDASVISETRRFQLNREEGGLQQHLADTVKIASAGAAWQPPPPHTLIDLRLVYTVMILGAKKPEAPGRTPYTERQGKSDRIAGSILQSGIAVVLDFRRAVWVNQKQNKGAGELKTGIIVNIRQMRRGVHMFEIPFQVGYINRISGRLMYSTVECGQCSTVTDYAYAFRTHREASDCSDLVTAPARLALSPASSGG